jgi:CheY-like chemotaxis protein
MPKLFLSYSRLDEQSATRLFSDLRDRGLEVWFDKESLLPGQDWKAEIEKAIAESDFVALLLSNNSVAKKGFFQKEVRLTLDVLQTIPFGHVYLLPVKLDNCKVPSPLASLHFVDLFPDWDKGIAKLIKSIDSQSKIQLTARISEKATGTEEPRILLVNDEPASMNVMVDIWKSQKINVDFAFDVPHAIEAIQNRVPSVVVSDLSHYSFGKRVTERAGFEILEWARQNNKHLYVIITTYDLTDQRREEAIKLGAVGICNNVPDLNDIISKIIGRTVSIPEGVFSSIDTIELPSVKGKKKRASKKLTGKNILIISDGLNEEFSDRLAADLIAMGCKVTDDRPIPAGAAAMNVGYDWMRFDATLIILSKYTVAQPYSQAVRVLTESFKPIWGRPTIDRKDIIPIVLDNDGFAKFDRFLLHINYSDFRNGYGKSFAILANDLEMLPSKKYMI